MSSSRTNGRSPAREPAAISFISFSRSSVAIQVPFSALPHHGWWEVGNSMDIPLDGRPTVDPVCQSTPHARPHAPQRRVRVTLPLADLMRGGGDAITGG